MPSCRYFSVTYEWRPFCGDDVFVTITRAADSENRDGGQSFEQAAPAVQPDRHTQFAALLPSGGRNC